MWQYKCIFSSMFMVFVANVVCEPDFINFLIKKDECEGICFDDFCHIIPQNKKCSVCQRGCRLFNVIDLLDGHSLNETKQECYVACTEAYAMKDVPLCKVGCEAMMKRKRNNTSDVLIFIEQDIEQKIMPEFFESELFEADIPFDPSIKSQLINGYNIKYKIPETHIRTIPVEEMSDLQKKRTTRWFSCNDKKLTVPKWICIGTLSFVFVVVLWIYNTPEKKVYHSTINELDDDNKSANEKQDLEKAILLQNEMLFVEVDAQLLSDVNIIDKKTPVPPEKA